MKKWDYYIVGICISLAVVGLIIVNCARTDGSNIVVTIDGNEYGIYTLLEDQSVDILIDGEVTNTLVIREGKAYMSFANCPDKVCINQGSVFKNHESICCAPNHIVATVISNEVGEFDAITQ